MPKLLTHLYVNSEYSIWIDGYIALRDSAEKIVADFLDDCDLAVFRHRTRRCTYEEAAVCAQRELDSPATIDLQVRAYRERGLAANLGLAECSVIVRRNNRKCEEFNHLWWSHYCRYSARDQISFMYAAQVSGIRYRLVTPTKFEHPSFDVIARPPQPEPLVETQEALH